MHRRVQGIDFTRVTRPSRSLFGLDDYAVSKLANILFVFELARRQPAERAYAVHPGFVDTAIIPRYAKPFLRRSLISPEQGASTVVWCATDPGLADESGHYYREMRRIEPSPAAVDRGLAAELWARSEAWCGVTPQP
jgi:NAD(P)-dependent dehydrogenase (short-subunit alcohol dehydrogenase family)